MDISVSDVKRAHAEIVDGLSKGELLRMEWEVERELGKQDTYYLAKYILEYDKMGGNESTGFHIGMCRFWDQWQEYNQLHLHPRKHFKTSVIGVAGNTRNVLNDPDMAMCYMCNTLGMSRSVVDEIKNHFLQNDKFRALYPEHAADPVSGKGTQDAFTTPARRRYNRYPTFMTAGADVGIVGKHFKYIFFDDIVDDKNTNTAELVDKIYKNVMTSLSTASKNKFDQPWHYLIGTRWHYFDTYQRIIDRWRRDPSLYKVMVTRAEWEEKDPENGRSIRKILFPEQFSAEYLDYLKHEECQNRYVYSCLYLNCPVPDSDVQMDPNKLKFYKEDDKWFKELKLETAMFVDPARSKETNRDPTVILILSVDCDSNYYVRHVDRFWGDPKKVVDRVIHLANAWQLFDVGFEEVAAQLYGLQWIEEKRDQQGFQFVMHPVKRPPTSKKADRHDIIIPYLNEGKIWVREDEPELDVIRREFREHPYGRYDDFKDTLADGLHEPILKPPPKPRGKEEDERFKKQPARHADRNTSPFQSGFRRTYVPASNPYSAGR